MTNLADETKLPKDRRESCVTSDYPSISSSWMSVLPAPDQPKTNIETIYGEGKAISKASPGGMLTNDPLSIVADLMSDAVVAAAALRDRIADLRLYQRQRVRPAG